jgi:hypothetical protein
MRALAVLLVGLVGCESGLPRLSIPQLEQAQQSVKGGGQRYEDYGACRKGASDVPALVSCMQDAGYDFVPRSAEVQATECWRLRDAPELDRLPEAWCFIKRIAPTQD